MGAYVRERYWWAAIPGLGLLGLGVAVLLEGWAWAGSLFLLGLGAGFGAAYLADRTQWWALIPGGILLSLAGVALVEGVFPGTEAGWLLFLGMAATFGLLFVRGQSWALWPALGVLVPLGFTYELLRFLLAYAFPLALIGVGGYLLWRSLRGP
jgi:hypothetical protein